VRIQLLSTEIITDTLQKTIFPERVTSAGCVGALCCRSSVALLMEQEEMGSNEDEASRPPGPYGIIPCILAMAPNEIYIMTPYENRLIPQSWPEIAGCYNARDP